MRLLICLLLPCCLTAQAPALVRELTLDLRTELGADPVGGIPLTPPGCWDLLILGASMQPAPPPRRRAAEATVEVWDLALRESNRGSAFNLYLGILRQRLSRAMELPPPSHASLELSELMQSDSGRPQKLDLTRVKSMQDRFNGLPPSGSPVK
ncbi:MAG: hypothetical protein Q8K67_12175 [Geothrix sp.]|nr:hypothetical protein [Geothrix sp.]